MSNSYFRFKQFVVYQDRCAMKVGTDGVLVGAAAPIGTSGSVLDIGTGSGLIALMIAQRSSATVVGIEIEKDAAEQAKENINMSPWQDRIQIVQGDALSYNFSKKFDFIVTNPPFFAYSLKSPSAGRSIARHTDTLTFDGLFHIANKWLNPDGLFSLIIPYDIASKIVDLAFIYNLHLSRRLDIFTLPDRPPKRTLLTFSFNEKGCVNDLLTIERKPKEYTEEFKALLSGYYLFI